MAEPSEDFRLLSVEISTCDFCHSECADYRQRDGRHTCILCVDLEAQAFSERNAALERVVGEVLIAPLIPAPMHDGACKCDCERCAKWRPLWDAIAALAEPESEAADA